MMQKLWSWTVKARPRQRASSTINIAGAILNGRTKGPKPLPLAPSHD